MRSIKGSAFRELTLIKITRVEHLSDRVLRLTFSDGTIGDYDLSPVVERDAPMVEPLKDPA